MEKALQTRQRLPTDGAADYVGLTVSTLEKLRLTGDGPEYVKLGRRVSTVEAWTSGSTAHRTRVDVGIAAAEFLCSSRNN